MKHGLIMLLFASMVQAWGCAATKGMKASPEAPQEVSRVSPMVVDRFVRAKVFEFQGDYDKAIVELGALLADDLTSAPVYQALARDYLIVGNEKAALGFMEKAVHADPGSVRARRFLSMLYARTGDLDDAIRQSEQIIEMQEYSPQEVFHLVALYLREKKPEKAITLLKELQRRHPSPEVRMRLASVYSMTGRMGQAETLYRKLLQEYPALEEVALALGNLLEECGKKEEARAVYEDALQQRPTHERIRRRLGELYLSTKQWDRAIVHFKKLPQNPEIMQNLAMAYYHLQAYEDCRRIARDALERYGDDAPLYYYLGRSLTEMENFPEALKAFQNLIRLDEHSEDGWVNAGYVNLCMKHYAEAQSLLKQGLELLPHNSKMWFFLGVATANLKDFQRAVAALKKAVTLDPENVTYLFELGRVQERAGQFDEGIRTFEKLLSVDPEYTLALNYLGYLFADKGIRLDESLAMLKKAVDKEPQNGAFLDSLGWVYFRLGDLEKAEHYIERAAQLEQENAVIIEHLGDVAEALGKIEKAKIQWKRSLKLDPGNRSVQKKLELIGK